MAKTVKVVRGSVLTEALHYRLAASQTIAKGDLVRINAAGTVAIALGTSAAAGAVHGIALKNGATAGTADGETVGAGDLFPVAMFNSDTVVAIALPSDDAWDDFSTLTVGGTGPLTVTTQANALIDSVTAGIATVVGLPSDDQAFDPDQGDDVDEGFVYCTFAQAILDGRSA